MNIIAIENKAKEKKAKEILEMIFEEYEKQDYNNIEDLVNIITGNIEKNHLYLSDYLINNK